MMSRKRNNGKREIDNEKLDDVYKSCATCRYLDKFISSNPDLNGYVCNRDWYLINGVSTFADFGNLTDVICDEYENDIPAMGIYNARKDQFPIEKNRFNFRLKGSKGIGGGKE